MALIRLMGGALIAYAVPAASGANDAIYKRGEDTTDVVMTLDDDDDDTNDNTNDDSRSFNSGTGNSRDNTNSRRRR